MEQAGCDRIRWQYQPWKPQKHIPLVADIHFDSKLAMESIRQGADKIRMNPNTIGLIEWIKAVVEEAKTYRNDRNLRQKNLQSPISA